MKRSKFRDRNGRQIHEGDLLRFGTSLPPQTRPLYRLREISDQYGAMGEEVWVVENFDGVLVNSNYCIYKHTCEERWEVLRSGYDEDSFIRLWQ